ncbi:MAG: hypothetical protein ACRDP1_17385 [Nocardioidaceae bacterium]
MFDERFAVVPEWLYTASGNSPGVWLGAGAGGREGTPARWLIR